MHLMYFTEQPMSAYPAEEGRKRGATALMFSNRHFDPVAGSRLYNEYLEHYRLAEDVGFDGIMLNEHHNAPFCMQAKANIFAAILAGMTKKVKIVMLGNPLPLAENPIRLAEELAMIDMISKGRLVSGIVRGAGVESLALNANPAYNRERFEEAHDVLVKVLSEVGPMHWEGEHYQYRVLNPWVRPLQRPHPRIWVPGVFSTETIVWAAQHGYPYVALNTPMHLTEALWKVYDDAARETGYEPGPENRGYLLRVHVQDTEEEAIENARQFLWMQGQFTGIMHPWWANPPGYSSPTRRLEGAQAANRPVGSVARRAPFEQQLATNEIVAGTRDQVLEKLYGILETCRPSILMLWGNDGKVPHEASKRCIELLGTEVLPGLREKGKSLGLTDPFEIDAPVSFAHHQSRQATAVGAAATG
jgi:alkanesulfonate monooxygenase SsuD/methylene tetrahydromethanopterin reductase-like flavin-dependent oxidoreductase (luciferase family)